MDDFVKDYYALASAGERLRFLERAEQEDTLSENEKVLCALLKQLLHARFGAHPPRPHATDAFLAAFSGTAAFCRAANKKQKCCAPSQHFCSPTFS